MSGGIGSASTLDNILRYDAAEQAWKTAGKMNNSRVYHAVSLLKDVTKLCP